MSHKIHKIHWTFSTSPDEIKHLNPIALESGGFLYEIELKVPLQIPVRLEFAYFDVSSFHTMNFTSQELYFSTTSIKHIADADRVPFDNFRVEVALSYRRNSEPVLIGPFSKQSRKYGELSHAVCI